MLVTPLILWSISLLPNKLNIFIEALDKLIREKLESNVVNYKKNTSGIFIYYLFQIMIDIKSNH
jgi:hypothetical protein